MERDHLGELSLNGMIILKWIFKMWDGSMDWMELAKDRDRWWAILNAVMNLRVPNKTRGIAFLFEDMLDSEE
jgi:hypothetical protein